MFPYGYACEPLIPDFDLLNTVSTEMVKGIKQVGKSSFKNGDICNVIYPASGSSVDYAYGVENVKYSFAFELRDTGYYGFMLPAKQIVPSGEEIYASLVVLFNFISEHSNKTEHVSRMKKSEEALVYFPL